MYQTKYGNINIPESNNIDLSSDYRKSLKVFTIIGLIIMFYKVIDSFLFSILFPDSLYLDNNNNMNNDNYNFNNNNNNNYQKYHIGIYLTLFYFILFLIVTYVGYINKIHHLGYLYIISIWTLYVIFDISYNYSHLLKKQIENDIIPILMNNNDSNNQLDNEGYANLTHPSIMDDIIDASNDNDYTDIHQLL